MRKFEYKIAVSSVKMQTEKNSETFNKLVLLSNFGLKLSASQSSTVLYRIVPDGQWQQYLCHLNCFIGIAVENVV
jgi:hypothetical protein